MKNEEIFFFLYVEFLLVVERERSARREVRTHTFTRAEKRDLDDLDLDKMIID